VALKKNKVQNDEAIQLIIDMLEKSEEEIKNAIKMLNEHHIWYQWLRQDYEYKSKDMEKPLTSLKHGGGF
jgi:hypothetical protein